MFPPITRRWPMRNSAKWNEPIKNWIFFFTSYHRPKGTQISWFIADAKCWGSQWTVIRHPLNNRVVSATKLLFVCVCVDPTRFSAHSAHSANFRGRSICLRLTSLNQFFLGGIPSPIRPPPYDTTGRSPKKFPYNSFRTQVPPVGLDRDTVRMLMKFDTIYFWRCPSRPINSLTFNNV